MSNFGLHHLEDLEEYIKGGDVGRIEVDQYELHPWLGRADLVTGCISVVWLLRHTPLWPEELEWMNPFYAQSARNTRKAQLKF